MYRLAFICGLVLIILAISCAAEVGPAGTPAPTFPPPGLGIDRQTLIEMFDDDFAFTPLSTTKDGMPILKGETTRGQEHLGFIGPKENLTEVYHVAVPEFVDSHQRGMQNIRRWMLLKVIVPEWEDASGWMTARLHTLGPGDSETVEIEGKRINMDRFDHEGVAVYGLRITATR